MIIDKRVLGNAVAMCNSSPQLATYTEEQGKSLGIFLKTVSLLTIAQF